MGGGGEALFLLFGNKIFRQPKPKNSLLLKLFVVEEKYLSFISNFRLLKCFKREIEDPFFILILYILVKIARIPMVRILDGNSKHVAHP